MNIVNNKYTKNMAVDVKQLRIGSHVMWNGKRRKVDAITKDSITFRIADTEQKMYDSATIESVEPIAITPELPKELGFENGRVGIWWHWWKDGFHLQHRDESEYWHFHGDIGFRYFHELESLYYMIYETELIQD